MIQTDKYEEAMRQGVSRCGPARIRRRSSTTSPRSGTRVTERIGVDKQRAAYEAWAGKPNAYPTAS